MVEEDAAPSGAAANRSERNALKRRSNAKWLEVRRAAELAKELGAKAVTLHGITMWLPKPCEHVKTSRCRASAAKRGGARSAEGGRVHRKQDAAQDRLEPAAEEQVQAVEPPVCAKLSKAKQRSRERLLEFQQKKREALLSQQLLPAADPRASLGTSADTHRLGEAGSAHAAAVNSSVDAFGQSGTALSGVEPAAAGDPIFGQSLGTRITSLGTSSGAAHHGAADS